MKTGVKSQLKSLQALGDEQSSEDIADFTVSSRKGQGRIHGNLMILGSRRFRWIESPGLKPWGDEPFYVCAVAHV
jgi:hypothetical protein